MKEDENHCEGITFDVSEAAAAATDDLLPCKSKERYESFWSIYSMLKSVFLLKQNLEINKLAYCNKLIAYLKRKSTGYQPKKSKCLSRDQIHKFLLEDLDKDFLLVKVVSCDKG